MPLYNEAGVLEHLYRDIRRILKDSGCDFELIFINDGSTDGSAEILETLADHDSSVKVLHFSRNFGHQAAVHAGLVRAHGDAVIVMDTDLQDDPCQLPEFIRCWEAGFDVVYAVRSKRKEGPVKRAMFYLFYRLLNLFSTVPMPNDAGNFGLIDRRVARHPGPTGRARPLLPWPSPVGGIPADRQCGWSGEKGMIASPASRTWGYSGSPRPRCSPSPRHLWGCSILVSFGSVLVCCGSTCFALYHKLVTGLAVAGWTIHRHGGLLLWCSERAGHWSIGRIRRTDLRTGPGTSQVPHRVRKKLRCQREPSSRRSASGSDRPGSHATRSLSRREGSPRRIPAATCPRTTPDETSSWGSICNVCRGCFFTTSICLPVP